MAFGLNTPYYQLPGFQREPIFGAFVEMLLKTRVKLHLEATDGFPDEDVNTYLAGLLIAYLNPAYLKAVSGVLFRCDSDVFQTACRTDDRYRAYWVYKVNADDLLVTLGIFRRLWQEERSEVIRMQRYYTHACEYNRRIYRRRTAVGEIHTKLAESSERYLTILAGTRRDYFHFLEHAQSEEMIAFSRNLHKYEREQPVKAAKDEFLDLYSAWLKGARDSASLERLLQLADQIKSLDPAFRPDSIVTRINQVKAA